MAYSFKVENATYRFPHKLLFTNLSFTLSSLATDTQILHIRGGNGVGKSTLLACIAGLHQLQAGSITFKNDTEDEFAISKSTETPCVPWSYLGAESNGFLLRLDAQSNLNFYLHCHQQNLPTATLKTGLEAWGFKSQALQQELPLLHFSTGMRRRLALLKIQLLKKPLWILDEPSAGLDQKGCTQLVQMLKQHKQRGGLAILVCHDHPLMAACSDATLDLG